MYFTPSLLPAAIISIAASAPSSIKADTNAIDERTPKTFHGWKVVSSGIQSFKDKRGAVHFDYTKKRSVYKRETYQADLDYLSGFFTSTNAHFLTRLDAAGGCCNSCTIAKWQEYGSMTAAQRIAYTNAILCLQNKTANTLSALVPGAKTRYDDFVATHINQSMEVHFTGTFLAWHRYFSWTYEQSLRNECGYDGYQPYFNWPLWAESPPTSPLFDGCETSLSGNGEYIPGHTGALLTATGTAGQDVYI